MGRKDLLMTILAVCFGLLALASFVRSGQEYQLQSQTNGCPCVPDADGI